MFVATALDSKTVTALAHRQIHKTSQIKQQADPHTDLKSKQFAHTPQLGCLRDGLQLTGGLRRN
jgi:hypothetical protein